MVASERKPGGVGEPGVPLLAAVIGNALFVPTGKRLRALPLAAERAGVSIGSEKIPRRLKNSAIVEGFANET